MPGPWLRFSLSIRDLLWFVVLAASLTIWGKDHQQRAATIDKLDDNWLVARLDWADRRDPEERQHRTLAAKLAKLSDEELSDYLTHASPPMPQRHPDFEACLAELASRGLVAPLQQQWDAIPHRADAAMLHRDLEILTALRRAQGKPDPLHIQVRPADREHTGYGDNAILLEATLTNVDVGRDAFVLLQGGDYRGGRRDRWQLMLIDQHGWAVANSNYLSVLGGGLLGFSRLRAGETAKETVVFDLRRYVSPPRSGKYWLHAYYHNDLTIAGDRNFTGLIVSKSEPIAVTVVNPQDRQAPWLPAEARPIAAILTLGGLFTLLALARTFCPSKRISQSDVEPPRWGRRSMVRDVCWGALILAVGVGYWADYHYQTRTIARLHPDADAIWTLSLGHDD